MYNHDIERRSI